jgi:hypothetical protein
LRFGSVECARVVSDFSGRIDNDSGIDRRHECLPVDQTAVQLPGEAPNTATEGPATTASQPGVPSSAFCNSAIPSTAGALSLGNLSGGMPPNGC